MLKVGVLTLPFHINYGGVMQAYALSAVLKEKGHDVWFINRDHMPQVANQNIIASYSGTPGETGSTKKRDRFLSPTHDREELIRISRTYVQEFVDEFLGQYVTMEKVLDTNAGEFDAIVVGGDQIWRPKYFPIALRPTENMFLAFAEKWQIKRLSYAASFGVDRWEFSSSETENCARLAKLFDAVSVRETSGVQLCEEYLNVNAEHVLDPTMLLDSVDYNALISRRVDTAGEKPGVFAYLLDPLEDKKLLIDRVASHLNQRTTEMILNKTASLLNDEIPGDRIAQPTFDPDDIASIVVPPIESWLTNIRDASFVVTDSYHGCIFSIIFQKPFIAYANRRRGVARFSSLLGLLGLEDRLVFTSDEFNEEKLTVDPEWGRVNEFVAQQRSKSLNFLDSAFQV